MPWPRPMACSSRENSWVTAPGTGGTGCGDVDRMNPEANRTEERGARADRALHSTDANWSKSDPPVARHSLRPTAPMIALASASLAIYWITSAAQQRGSSYAEVAQVSDYFVALYVKEL